MCNKSLKTNDRRGQWLSVYVSLILILASINPLWAQDNGKQQDGEGKYAQLSGVWWQWIFSQPALDVAGTNTNPVLDTTGDYASVGQEQGIGPANKYFFLAGAFGGDVERTATIPAGKTLFFPVVNFEADNAVDPITNNTIPQLRAIAKASIDDNVSRYARLNGQEIDMFRTKSPVFSYTVPDENSLYDYFGLVGAQFEGTIRPVVSDGYWAMIPPLAPGTYLIEFGGTGSIFSLNVTYHLTIE